MYCTVSIMLHQNRVLYCTVLYCTLLYCTVLYCTVLYCTVSIMLHQNRTEYCTVLYCTILYCTVSIMLHQNRTEYWEQSGVSRSGITSSSLEQVWVRLLDVPCSLVDHQVTFPPAWPHRVRTRFARRSRSSDNLDLYRTSRRWRLSWYRGTPLAIHTVLASRSDHEVTLPPPRPGLVWYLMVQ